MLTRDLLITMQTDALTPVIQSLLGNTSPELTCGRRRPGEAAGHMREGRCRKPAVSEERKEGDDVEKAGELGKGSDREWRGAVREELEGRN